MTDTMRRRHLLIEQGEPMFLYADPFAIMARAGEFRDASAADGAPGFTASDLFISPIYGHTLPVAKTGSDGELLPWSDIAPSLLWHPLLWLPKHIALPSTVRTRDGGVREENRLEWAMRVAIEVHHAGLWVPDRGWADVLALNGLDVEDPTVVGRIAAWQAGGTDAALDAIDLSGFFDSADELSWASERAVDLNAILHPVAMGMHAASILDGLEAAETTDDVVVACGGALVTIALDSVEAAQVVSAMWDELEQPDADHEYVRSVLIETARSIVGVRAGDIAEYREQLDAEAAAA